MLIDLSYFNGEITIPNTDQESVSQNINWFINKYEPQFLETLLGYTFYKAFVLGISTTLPDFPEQRWQDLIYGAEYTSSCTGKLTKWKGLIITQIPVYEFGSGFIYKAPVWIQADVIPGFISGVNTAIFPDWIGWTPVIERKGQGTMKEGVDYSFISDADDDNAGLLTLLVDGDKFQANEYFYVTFQLRAQDQQPIDSIIKQSLIANYVYYWYMRNSDSNTTGIGETKTKPTGSTSSSAHIKAVRAWNEMVDWIYSLRDYLESSLAIYPEYDSLAFKCSLRKVFQIMNPFF